MPFINQAQIKGTKVLVKPPNWPPNKPWPPPGIDLEQPPAPGHQPNTVPYTDENGVVTPLAVVTNNQVQATTVDPGVGASYSGGFKYNSAGAMYTTIATPSGNSNYAPPFRFASDGALYVTLDAPVYYNGGLPFNAAGALCYSSNAGDRYVQGWPLNAAGVCMAGVASVPDAPSTPTAVAGDGQATVTWTPPAFTGGLPITGYVVRSNPATTNQNASASPHVFTGLTNGTAYGFEVAAVNAMGQGPFSSTSATVTPNPQPMTFIPLLTTVVPTTSAAPTATFTRTSTAYVPDFEGVLKRAISGEIRFWGARRVHNVVLKSQDFSNTSEWPVDFGSVTRTANYGTAPDGTTTSTRMQFSGANGSWVQAGTPILYLHGKTPDNLSYRGSVYVKGTVGQTFNIWTRTNSTGSNQAVKQVTLTGGWDRITTDTFTLNNIGSADTPIVAFGTRNLDITLGTAADVQVWGAQLEAVSGQTNQAPSEYVSNGVNSSPFHGACVAGVKYFSVLNGNSVSGGIVTEATGAVIADAVLRGYLSETNISNVCQRSQELDNASWTKTNCTVTADQLAAPDGSLTAELFTDNSTNGAHSVTYPYASSLTGGACISVHAKAGTLTWMQLSTTDGGAKYANFNLSTGAVGSATSGFNPIIEPLGNGWYRCAATWTGTGSPVPITISSLNGNTASAAPSYVGSGQTMYLWGAQIENEYQATSYIPTTTATASRVDDLLTYVSAGNYLSTVGSAYAEYTTYGIVGDNKNHTLIGGSGLYMLNATSQKAAMNNGSGGTLQVTNNCNVAGGLNKAMCRWNFTGSTRGIIQNGGTIVTGAWGSSYGETAIWVGKWSGSSGAAKGGVRNVKFYSSALTNAQMTALTT